MNISHQIINLIDEIRNDKTHGASQLARRAIEILKTAAEQSQAGTAQELRLEQQEIGQRLVVTRPAMAPIFNIVGRLQKAIAEDTTERDLEAAKQSIISKASELINDSLEAVNRIARHGSYLISPADRIMTHSYSSTVTAVLKEAFTKHRDIEVIVTRSGPGRTGEEAARELASQGIPITFIDDTAIGLYLTTTNKAMVGADRVCADDSLVNGIGTYQLALACKKAGIPLYVLCETLKFDPRISSSQVDLEEKEPHEVVAQGKLPASVKVKNPYFDITPMELITTVVTEKGLLDAKEVTDYLKTLN